MNLLSHNFKYKLKGFSLQRSMRISQISKVHLNNEGQFNYGTENRNDRHISYGSLSSHTICSSSLQKTSNYRCIKYVEFCYCALNPHDFLPICKLIGFQMRDLVLH